MGGLGSIFWLWSCCRRGLALAATQFDRRMNPQVQVLMLSVYLIPFNIQLVSDFHRCFVQFQETLCNLTGATDQNPFKSPRPEEVESAVLKALSSYRSAIKNGTDDEQIEYFDQVNSFMYLLQVSIMRQGKGKIEASHLESWIDECFPGIKTLCCCPIVLLL